MLTSYIQSAMRRAHYELTDGDRFRGEILGLSGVSAEGDNLEACREALQEALEEWMVAGLREGRVIPILDGFDLNLPPESGMNGD